MSYDDGALSVSTAFDNICTSVLQAFDMCTLRPTGGALGASPNSKSPFKLVTSSRSKGPGVEVDGADFANLAFFVGGTSNFLMFGGQVFVARPSF